MSPEGLPSAVGELKVPRFSPATWSRPAADAVLISLPTRLAGKGTARQLEQASGRLSRRLGARSTPFAYVGQPVDCGVAELRRPLASIEVPEGQGVAGIYRAGTAAFEKALRQLHDRGCRRPAIVCMGYTSYGPEAVRRALEALGSEGLAMEAIVCLVDSSYPDVEELGAECDDSGWPASRFHAPAYRSTQAIRTLFLVTSAYGYDPMLLNGRAPEGLDGVGVVAPPYSEEYVSEIEGIAREGKEAGLGPVEELLPGLRHRAAGEPLIPIVGSDIWSPDAVGAWMTHEQHDSCLEGTRSIVQALAGVAERIERRVWVPIDLAGADHVRGLGISRVAVLPGGELEGASVVLSAYRDLSQRHHARLLGAADVAVSRTGGQANSTVVLALARTPNVVLDMPACGYMQSELTSLAMLYDVSVDDSGRVACADKAPPLGWLAHWTWPPERIQEQILEVLLSDEERRERPREAYRAYRELRTSGSGNLFEVVECLAGKT